MSFRETVSYLEMTSAEQLRPGRAPETRVELARVEPPSAALNRLLYGLVGADWGWTDRLSWSIDQWRQWVERAGHETWLAVEHGRTLGYFELDRVGPAEVELAFFGILPTHLQRGLGAWLLGQAVAQAWRGGPQRVTVHTSSFDHPAALPNYVARGFQLIRQEPTLKIVADGLKWSSGTPREVSLAECDRNGVCFVEALSPPLINEVRRLFREYASSLPISLDFQNFTAESAGLPGAYARPHGRLLLAVDRYWVLGCVALRPLESGVAEVKRLFVSAAFRGRGIGRGLMRAALAAAAEIGYDRVRLDSLATMTAAQRLYESLGFRPVEPYCHNPSPHAVFMAIDRPFLRETDQ